MFKTGQWGGEKETGMWGVQENNQLWIRILNSFAKYPQGIVKSKDMWDLSATPFQQLHKK